jgi:cell division protein FtsB
VNLNKLIHGTFAALFALVAVGAGVFFVRLHGELAAVRAHEAANQRRIAEAQARLQEQEKYLEQLRHDPALVERVIRRKLGYARPNEFVFRFED